MIFLIFIASGVGILAMAYGILPCGVVDVEAGCTTAFLPMPEQIGTMITNVFGAATWATHLAGEGIANAIMVSLGFMITVSLTIFVWKILNQFKERIPIINKYL